MRARVLAEKLSGFLDAIEFNETISSSQGLLLKEKIKLIIDALDDVLVYPTTLEEFLREAEEKFGKTKEIGSPYGEFEYEFGQDDNEYSQGDEEDECIQGDEEDNYSQGDEEDVDFTDVETLYEVNDNIEETLEWLNGFYQAIESDPLFNFKRSQVLLLKEKIQKLIIETKTLTPYNESEDNEDNE